MVAVAAFNGRRPSTLAAVEYRDTWEKLGAQTRPRNAIDPSVRYRSMDPGLTSGDLLLLDEASIITSAISILLILLLATFLRIAISTRSSRRKHGASPRDMEEAGATIRITQLDQRVRATLKFGVEAVDLGDSSINLINLSSDAPPAYNAAMSSSPSSSPPSTSAPLHQRVTFATTPSRQHRRGRADSGSGYIRVTVLVAVPGDTPGSTLYGVPGDPTDSEISVTDTEEDSDSFSEPDWDSVLEMKPRAPFIGDRTRHPEFTRVRIRTMPVQPA